MKPRITHFSLKGIEYWMCVGDLGLWQIGRGRTPAEAYEDAMWNTSIDFHGAVGRKWL